MKMKSVIAGVAGAAAAAAVAGSVVAVDSAMRHHRKVIARYGDDCASALCASHAFRCAV